MARVRLAADDARSAFAQRGGRPYGAGMRNVIVGGAMAVVLAACTATPGATVIVERDAPPTAIAASDASTPSETSPKLDLDAGHGVDAANADADHLDSSVADAAEAGPPPCQRDTTYDSYCAGDAGHAGITGGPHPYAYTCDGVVGHYPGNDCISTPMGFVRWCCETVQP